MVDPSRHAAAWIATKPWVLRKDIVIVLVISALNVVRVLALEHHHWSTGLIESAIVFVIATVLLGAIVYGFNYSIHPLKMVLADVKGHLSDHPRAALAPLERVVPAPVLAVSPVPGGSLGRLFEKIPPISFGVQLGQIYVTVKIHVAAGDDQSPVIISRVKAFLKFDDGQAQEVQSAQFDSLDVMFRGDNAEESGPVEIYKNRMLELKCNFIADADSAILGVDEDGMTYHLPTTSQVEELVVYDSLNRAYRLAEPIVFPTYRWEESTPFQPG